MNKAKQKKSAVPNSLTTLIKLGKIKKYQVLDSKYEGWDEFDTFDEAAQDAKKESELTQRNMYILEIVAVTIPTSGALVITK